MRSATLQESTRWLVIKMTQIYEKNPPPQMVGIFISCMGFSFPVHLINVQFCFLLCNIFFWATKANPSWETGTWFYQLLAGWTILQREESLSVSGQTQLFPSFFFFVNFFKKTRRETDFHLKVYIKQLNRSQNKHPQSTRQFESPLLLQVYCWCPFTQPRVYHDSLNNNSWTFIDFFFHVIQHPTCVTFLIAEQHTHTHTHDGQILKTLTAAQYKQKWGLAKELDDRAKSKWISIHHVNFYLSLCWR